MFIKAREEKVLRTGDCVYARTHTEFLNKTFDANLKGFMRTVWYYKSGVYVWMVRFDGVEHDGWKNVFIDKNTIKETYRGGSGEPMRYAEAKTRIVIEIQEGYAGRKYIFKGLFKVDEKNTDGYTVRIHKKISDEFRYY